MSEEDRIVNELLERNGKIRLARKVYKLENIIKEAIEYHDNCVNNLLDLDKIDENERLAYKVAYEIHYNYLKILKENKQ